MMKAVLKPELKSKTYCISKSYSRLEEKEIGLINTKFYQKLKLLIHHLPCFLVEEPDL